MGGDDDRGGEPKLTRFYHPATKGTGRQGGRAADQCVDSSAGKEANVIILGQIALLVAMVGSGYACFACLLGAWSEHAGLARSGRYAAALAMAALTTTASVLTWALLTGDQRLAYVARYSSPDLPRHYALAAFWVGQAGSLLLWAWLAGMAMLLLQISLRRRQSPLSDPALGILAGYLCFLVVLMTFGADPMKLASPAAAPGPGLVPELRHPAMLLHPPVIFLSYATWAVPFALALAALLTGRLDAEWLRRARPWTLFSWATLGIGILLGAEWAYEELGWGGYWNWDPVENGSLLPWLAGTALIHTSIVWQRRASLKKTTAWLAIMAFSLCVFATFLTRSAVFGGLHTFNRSPLGWMFLWMLLVMLGGSAALVFWRREMLKPEHRLGGILSRETLIALSTVAILLLAAAVLIGTIAGSVAQAVLGWSLAIDRNFYDPVAAVVGIVTLAGAALAPLTRWGGPPGAGQLRALVLSAAIAMITTLVAVGLRIQNPVALVAAFFTALLMAVLVSCLIAESRNRPGRWSILRTLCERRRFYAGCLVHVGYACLIVGITGSSLGTQQVDVDLTRGEPMTWAGRSLRFVELTRREHAGVTVVEAHVELAEPGKPTVALQPAQKLYADADRWRGEVAVLSTWRSDFYVVLHGGEGSDKIHLTLRENPLMRWMWLSGWLMGVGTLIAIWPGKSRATASDPRGERSGAAS